MDDKYPRVARAKQAQKFTDTLIERWREMLQPIGKCSEGLFVYNYIYILNFPVFDSVGIVHDCTHPVCSVEGVQDTLFILIPAAV